MFSPRSMTSLGSNPDAPAKRVEAETDILRGLFSTIFQELLSESEVQRSIQELPVRPTIPSYTELCHKPSLFLRLQRAFAQFDLDSTGSLSPAELKVVLRKVGIRAQTVQVKDFMRSLDSNGDGEVDLREFCQNCPGEVALAIENALDDRDHYTILDRQAQRRKEREEAAKKAKEEAALADMEETDKAAMAIQGKMRQRKAKQKVLPCLPCLPALLCSLSPSYSLTHGHAPPLALNRWTKSASSRARKGRSRPQQPRSFRA